MKNLTQTLSIAVIGLALMGLSACHKPDDVSTTKGPAETAGAKIDAATAKAATELNKLGEKAGEGLEKAGAKMQNAARDAQTNNDQK